MTSIAFASSASVAVTFAASVTICSARSALRPCDSASARMKAAASFSIFWPRRAADVAPGRDHRVAEPMFVCGAIAATSAASVMKAPAEAARAPFG